VSDIPRVPDFIVVGAGSSGAVLVNRLTEDPAVSVVLLEAGVSGERDPLVTTPGRWVSLLGTSYDWSYVTDPEPGLEGRRLACPRGKAQGGSSAINAMVHIRGHRDCYDEWKALGNPGWGYDELLPFFERSDALAISPCRDPHASHLAFLDGAHELGFDSDSEHDFNAPNPDGVAGFVRKNIDDGRRHSTSSAFLEPAMSRRNLTIVRAQATRLVCEGRRVVGVEYLREGYLERLGVRREVVLSAGVIESPKLMMLSGIGAADDLHEHAIAVVANRPGVGRNLQDHVKLSLRWIGTTSLQGSTVTAGLFTSSGLRSGRADLQFYVGRGLAQSDDLVTITVSLVRVDSRGRVTLQSVDPTSPPRIQVNYLRERIDVDALLGGVELARRFGRTNAYRPLVGEEVDPGRTTTSAFDLEQFIRQKSDTIYHVAGTCKMGPASDPMAVVDHELRVHEVEGLRVADASIMPELVNAPTHAACVMIGEKCASLLR